MRLQTFFAVAFVILLSAPLMADDLQIEANGNGVKVEGKQFLATAAHISIDIAKGTLTLDGTKETPAKFVPAAFGPKDRPAMFASRIIYNLNDGNCKLEDSRSGRLKEFRLEIPISSILLSHYPIAIFSDV